MSMCFPYIKIYFSKLNVKAEIHNAIILAVKKSVSLKKLYLLLRVKDNCFLFVNGEVQNRVMTQRVPSVDRNQQRISIF